MAKRIKHKNECTAVAVRSTVRPPPSKAEICEALLRRACVKHEAKRSELRQTDMAAQEALDKEVLKLLAAGVNVQSFDHASVTSDGVVEVKLKLKDASLRHLVARKIETSAAYGEHSWFREDEAKARIREQVYCARVVAMLKDPDTVKSLDAVLLRVGSIEA
ncbi:MAG TPA: hypothetical protein VGR14_22410 [Verrucomicrobiae bacterium]|jgi:hypothetical protein|nr:hypothetical protein [Verrucomicrobiae bacterium]